MKILVLTEKGGFSLDDGRLGPHELKALSEQGYDLVKIANDSFFMGYVEVRDAPPAGSSFMETGVNQVDGKTYEIKWEESPEFDWAREDLDLTADPKANRQVHVVDEDRVREAEERSRIKNATTERLAVEQAQGIQQTTANAKADINPRR